MVDVYIYGYSGNYVGGGQTTWYLALNQVMCSLISGV